jgi:hypothetical protein
VTTDSCARCGRALTPETERHIPRFLAAATEIAFAFFHGGMWAKEALGKPFCARCARIVDAVAVAISAVVLAAASFGLALWLHGPGR